MTNKLTRRLLTAAALAIALPVAGVCLVLTLVFKMHEGGIRAVLSEVGFFGLVAIVVVYAIAVVGALRRRRALS